MIKYKATCKVMINGEIYYDYIIKTSAHNTYQALRQVEIHSTNMRT